MPPPLGQRVHGAELDAEGDKEAEPERDADLEPVGARGGRMDADDEQQHEPREQGDEDRRQQDPGQVPAFVRVAATTCGTRR